MLRTSFEHRLAAMPLRAKPSPPSGWLGDFHPKLSNMLGTRLTRALARQSPQMNAADRCREQLLRSRVDLPACRLECRLEPPLQPIGGEIGDLLRVLAVLAMTCPPSRSTNMGTPRRPKRCDRPRGCPNRASRCAGRGARPPSDRPWVRLGGRAHTKLPRSSGAAARYPPLNDRECRSE